MTPPRPTTVGSVSDPTYACLAFQELVRIEDGVVAADGSDSEPDLVCAVLVRSLHQRVVRSIFLCGTGRVL